MDKQSNVKTLVLALGLLSLSGLVQAEAVKGGSQQQMAKSGESDKKSNDAGLNPAHEAAALIKAGQDPAAVVKAAVSANPAVAAIIAASAVAVAPSQASVITNAAISAAPDQRRAIINAVLTVPGVNPSMILASPAAGNSAEPGKALKEGYKGRKGGDHEKHHGGGHAYGHCKQDKHKHDEDCASPS